MAASPAELFQAAGTLLVILDMESKNRGSMLYIESIWTSNALPRGQDPPTMFTHW